MVLVRFYGSEAPLNFSNWAMKGKDIWGNRPNFQESSLIFNLKYFESEVSLFPRDW